MSALEIEYARETRPSVTTVDSAGSHSQIVSQERESIIKVLSQTFVASFEKTEANGVSSH